MICPKCNSNNVKKKGLVHTNSATKQRYKCKDCLIQFAMPIQQPVAAKPTKPGRTWVITTAISNMKTNILFKNTLESYCAIRGAELLIVPMKYKTPEHEDYNWDPALQTKFITNNITLTNGLKLFGGLNISPSLGNPLSGFEQFSKGKSIIIPHPQLMMKTIAMSHTDKSVMMTTTGSISETIYTETKQGERASFNHSYSALVVEEDPAIDGFHLRVLNSDESGAFYDMDKFYDGYSVSDNTNIPAIVLGDEHVIHIDPMVKAVTFDDRDSIVNTLKPKVIVRHDVLDFYSASHHHKHNVFTQYAKYISGKNNIENELNLTYDYIADTTPSFAESIIVSSNHNSHLLRWLNECNPRHEPWNAKLYHQLMFLMLDATKMGSAMTEHPNPFELWANYSKSNNSVKFISGYESYKILDIELAHHGDIGINGSRASAVQYSKLGMKTIIGHSHSPQINGGCYSVGHSCYSKLEYNSGPSSWAHAHCIIQPNGKRQMIFIHDGKWRR